MYLTSVDLDIKKEIFTTIIHWNNIPRDVVKSPSPKVFKMQLVSVLADLL